MPETIAQDIDSRKGEIKSPRIVIAGNPNSGKTTLFNCLTGHRYKVANYPGVTVEKKEGLIFLGNRRCSLLDLPGAYSLSGDSIDEALAAKVLSDPSLPPDLVLCVVDSTNLERNLYLVSELIDCKFPVLLVLNMSDLARQQGIEPKTAILSRLLDLPVVAISAQKKEGIAELKTEIEHIISNPTRISKQTLAWNKGIACSSYQEQAVLRYGWLKDIVERSVVFKNTQHKARSDKVDSVLLHPIWGLATFVAIMAFLFQAIFTWAAYPMELIDDSITALGELVSHSLAASQIRSLLVDGVIAGVGSVVVFIPQIAILCFLISLLEDSGYLCRAAAIMDRLMRKVGLQGRSFIPLLSSFACAIPGIMATRTIPSLRDRLATIMVAPLMSCSARLPVYALLIAAFIPATSVYGIFSLQGLTLLGLYFLGIVTAAFVAFVLKLSLLKGGHSHFVMEMPPYRMPLLSTALRNTWDRLYLFIKDVGTIILSCSILLWFLSSYPSQPDLEASEQVKHSYAGQVGQLIEPVIRPLGYDWKIGIGILASFAAREVFVSSLATIYSIESEEDSLSLITALQQTSSTDGSPAYGLPTALSLMVFFALACQCVSTLAVCKKETASWKWPALMFVYMTLLAYGGAFATFQIATWFSS